MPPGRARQAAAARGEAAQRREVGVPAVGAGEGAPVRWHLTRVALLVACVCCPVAGRTPDCPDASRTPDRPVASRTPDKMLLLLNPIWVKLLGGGGEEQEDPLQSERYVLRSSVGMNRLEGE